jgi:S-adenosylhomocysteine hydrolase
MNYDIKDPKLASVGKKKIEWAEKFEDLKKGA